MKSFDEAYLVMPSNRYALPGDAELIRATPWFNDETVPAGLLRDHSTAAGKWGLLQVRSGNLRFVWDDDEGGDTMVSTGESLVIQPRVPHHVEPREGVEFRVEFYRAAGAD
jgi:tellurite resistance-related uncharacterized protein